MKYSNDKLIVDCFVHFYIFDPQTRKTDYWHWPTGWRSSEDVESFSEYSLLVNRNYDHLEFCSTLDVRDYRNISGRRNIEKVAISDKGIAMIYEGDQFCICPIRKKQE